VTRMEPTGNYSTDIALRPHEAAGLSHVEIAPPQSGRLPGAGQRPRALAGRQGVSEARTRGAGAVPQPLRPRAVGAVDVAVR
jgi:hypothetical protein